MAPQADLSTQQKALVPDLLDDRSPRLGDLFDVTGLPGSDSRLSARRVDDARKLDGRTSESRALPVTWKARHEGERAVHRLFRCGALVKCEGHARFGDPSAPQRLERGDPEHVVNLQLRRLDHKGADAPPHDQDSIENKVSIEGMSRALLRITIAAAAG